MEGMVSFGGILPPGLKALIGQRELDSFLVRGAKSDLSVFADVPALASFSHWDKVGFTTGLWGCVWGLT
jgi:hypothetical protein